MHYAGQEAVPEDIRVRHYAGIRNTMALVLAASYFAAVYLKDNLRLKVPAERVYLVSKRFFGVSASFSYAIADGLHNLLLPDKTGINHIQRREKPDFQLSFP